MQIIKIKCPEKKWVKSWSRGKMKTRIPLKNKEILVFGHHSHSMDAGGLVVTSKTTRLAWGTSLTILLEMRAIRS